MGSIKQLFGQTAVYGLGTILPRFLNYLLTPLYTYIFVHPEDYGINAEIYAYISFLNVVFTYGMETAFFHFSTKGNQPEKVFRVSYSLIILSTIFLSVLLFLMSDIIGEILHYKNLWFIYWAIGIVATDALLAIPFAYLRLQNMAWRFSVIKIFNVLVNIGFNLFFFLVCKRYYESGQASFWAGLYNPEIGIGYSFMSNLIANVVSILLMMPVFKRFLFQWDGTLVRSMLKYALPLLFVGLAGMVNETFDRIVLKYLLPIDEAQAAQGIYGACYKISVLMTIFIQAYRYAAEPFFFNTFKQTDAKATYAKTTEFFIFFGVGIWLVTLLNLPIIQYFIGPSYRVGLGVVPVLLSANLFLGIYFNLSFWYKLTGRTGIGAWITFVGAVLTLVINFIYVPKFSYYASAWATFAAYFSMMVLAYILGQRYYPVQYDLSRIFLCVGVAVLLYFISRLMIFSSQMIQLMINNILFLFYIGYVLFNYRWIRADKINFNQ